MRKSQRQNCDERLTQTKLQLLHAVRIHENSDEAIPHVLEMDTEYDSAAPHLGKNRGAELSSAAASAQLHPTWKLSNLKMSLREKQISRTQDKASPAKRKSDF